jgi:hypothetical protein
MITCTSRPRQREQIIAQQVEDTLVLLSLTGGEYYRLNEVGARVWALCDGSRSVAEVVACIGQEYEAPAATVEADVLALVEELADAQLVVVDPD